MNTDTCDMFSCRPVIKKKVKRRCYVARLNDFLFWLLKENWAEKTEFDGKYNQLRNFRITDFLSDVATWHGLFSTMLTLIYLEFEEKG